MRLAEAISRSGQSDAEVERVDDERSIRHHIPIDAVPGLLIDGRLVSQQQVPDIETLLDWLKKVVPT